MMSIYTARDTYGGRTDEPQSATLRALAWSEAYDSAPEPLPYTGADYSGPTVSISADTQEPQSAIRLRRSTLLSGIAAGFAAAAVGGLALAVMTTTDAPATTPVTVTQPVVSAVIPQPKPEGPTQVRQIRSSAPTRANTDVSSARPVPPAVSSQPTAVAPAPESQTLVAPEAAPAAVEPAAAESAAPEFTPPGTRPPVLTPPIVSLPEVAPQQVPHPVGPPTFHVPTMPQEGITLPPVNSVGASGAAGGVTLNPVVTLPPMIPTLSVGGGH